jgi:glycosyltransferase involved in cell wall biosynthesis
VSRVSIIIPTSRTGPRLGACLESIARQRLDPHEIDVHVVYNGVADPPLWRRENWPFRLFVDRIEQANISAAKNVALNAARGDWLLLINDDVILDGEFVAAHLEAHWRLGSPAMVLGLAAWFRLRRWSSSTTG